MTRLKINDESNCGNELLLVSNKEWLLCIDTETLTPGPYSGWRGKIHPFIVEVDAKPLAILIESAARGYRVYELMSLNRPGDVLHYFRIRLIDVDPDIENRVKHCSENFGQQNKDDSNVLALPDFDSLFSWDSDDTAPEAECWLRFREQSFWPAKIKKFFDLAMKCQKQLHIQGDYLIQHELDRFDLGTHWRNFASDLPRNPYEVNYPFEKTGLSPAFFYLIKELIVRETVQSVSYLEQDYALWRLLVEQQVRRANKDQKTVQEAFKLCGPDNGIPFVVAKDCGGEIHIPYEGDCDGDILIKTSWRKFRFEAMKSTCQFLLTQEDYGEQECAYRTVADDWILYEYKGLYIPSNHSL